MKRILTLVLLFSAGLTVLGQRNSDPASSGNKNQNNQNLNITPGASGVKRSIGYRFSSEISDGDPGSGSFRYNRDTVSKVSWMLVDDIDISGEDQTNWYSTWDKTTGATGRGRITLVEKDGKNIDVFDVSGVFSRSSGYWKIPVEYVSGRLPAGGTVYYYIFERIENKKDKTSDPAPEPVIPVAVIPVTPTPTPAPPTEPVVPQPVPQPEPTPVQPSPQPQPVSPLPVPTPEPASQATVVTPAPQPEPAPALPEPSPVQPVAAPFPEPVDPLAVVTPAPVTPAPVTPAPVTPAPVTPAPVTPAPVTPAPVTPVPVTPAPVTPAPVTPAPVTPAPVTPAPVTPAPAPVMPAPQPAPAPVQTGPASQPAPAPVQPAQNRRIAPDQNNRAPQDETAVTRTTRTSTTTRTPQTAPAVPAAPSGEASNRTAGSSDATSKSTTVPSQPAPAQQQPSQAPQQPVAVTKPASAPRPTTPATKPSQATVPSQPPAQATTPANQPPAGPRYTTSSWTSQSAANPPQESAGASLPTYQNPYGSGRSRGKWYHGIIEIGYAAGAGEYGISNFRFNFINGIHITPTFSAGLGLGYRYYFTERYSDRDLVSGKVQFPVFIDLRKTFSTRKVTPYLAFGIGNSARYSAASDSTDAVKEGLFLNPSGGIWFNISPRFAVFGGIAYEIQKMEYVRFSDNSHYKRNTSSVSLNIGISF